MISRCLAVLRAGGLALVTPLLEKNPAKTVVLGVPYVFSMSRAIVLAFAIGVLRQMWQGGVRGWPEATLAIAIVLALPLLGALDRVRPMEVLQLTTALFGRFGVGAVSSREPSKFDDHREDAT
jgi:hypothetical protein